MRQTLIQHVSPFHLEDILRQVSVRKALLIEFIQQSLKGYIVL